MRKVLSVFAAMLALTMVMQFAMAEDAPDAGASQKITGILIDNACAKGVMKKEDPDAAAAKHPRSCAMKESCEKSGYSVISGNKQFKLDENGNKLAKEFLAKSDKENDLRVTVEGTEKDGHIAVTAINAAPDSDMGK